MTQTTILDGDTGGLPEHFSHTVRTLEREGVSAIIIEDKIGPKKNSFWDRCFPDQDSIEVSAIRSAPGRMPSGRVSS